MVLSREALRDQLKKREFAPVYVLFGQEMYLRDVAARTIADRAFAEGDLRDFNENVFTLGQEGVLARALASAQQLPMMASRRVVRINDVRVSASGFRDTITEADEPLLSSYLSDPSPHTIVILVADELNGVRKMGKYLREKTSAVDFTPLNDVQMAEWARKEIRDSGAAADDLVTRYLLSRIGPDVIRLTNEIRKLATAALPNGVITTEMVDQLVPNTRELANFDLTDHLVAGRRPKALAVLEKILDDGAEPLALLGLLSYNYRRLLIAKDMIERGVERREIAKAVKLHYSSEEAFFAAARRIDAESLRRAIVSIARADLAIKTSIGGSGQTGARRQLEMLVCELAMLQPVRN